MRYAIFSDIHSNLEALEAVFNAYRLEAIDEYCSVGDIVGYAANPNECIEKIKDSVNISVAGNHDWASVGLFSLDYFNPEAKEAIIWSENNLQGINRPYLESLELTYQTKDFTLVHGTLGKPNSFDYLDNQDIALETFALMKTRICFVGHTHIHGILAMDKEGNVGYFKRDYFKIEEDYKYIINVGSIGQPRDGDPRAVYCVYDKDKGEIFIKRTDYDVEKTRKKVIAAGLPKFLGERLLIGR